MITEPGAEYDATYQSVIRIKTTRKKGEGLGLTYRQVYQRNHQNNHREVLDLNYRYRGLDIFSKLYGGLSQGYQDQHNDNRLYGKTFMSIDEDLIIKNKSYYTSGSLGFNYVFNDRHSVGATYEVNINPYSRGGWNSLMDVWKNGSKTESYTNDMYCRFKSRPTQDITAYYAGQIGKVSIEWNGEIYLRKIGQTQYSEETGMEGGDSRTIESDFTADSWMLMLSTDGVYQARQPVNRDVCSNPDGILQIDDAVLFPTERGIMMQTGSTAKLITDALDGAVFDYMQLYKESYSKQILAVGSIPEAGIKYIPFRQFMKGADMVYDYYDARIIVFNPDCAYAYVYSLKSGLWGAMESNIKKRVNIYPESYLMKAVS